MQLTIEDLAHSIVREGDDVLIGGVMLRQFGPE